MVRGYISLYVDMASVGVYIFNVWEQEVMDAAMTELVWTGVYLGRFIMVIGGVLTFCFVVWWMFGD